MVEKPWGSFKVLHEEEGMLVKILTINSGCRISSQKHMKRIENWVIVSGEGLIELNNKLEPLYQGASYKINKEDVHRVTNVGHEELHIIEVQIGICEEDDIIRLEDDYARV